MKKITLLTLALAAGAALHAADAAKSSYSITLDFPYVSKYVFRGVEVGKEAIQPSVEISSGGSYGGLWSSQPVLGRESNEFDFYAGYKHKLNDAWDLDMGATLYYYPEAKKSLGEQSSTYEVFAGVVGNVRGFKPGLYIYNDFKLDTLTVQGQVGYSVALPDVGASLDFSANFGSVYPNSGPQYTYGGVGVNLPYKLGEKATVYAGLNYANSDLQGAARDLFSFRAGVTVGF
ncbi:MAG: hypothetical protein HZA31_09250 [Opitutae bacterium]|nr:hypothetical protein [Opitutae bacterium]